MKKPERFANLGIPTVETHPLTEYGEVHGYHEEHFDRRHQLVKEVWLDKDRKETSSVSYEYGDNGKIAKEHWHQRENPEEDKKEESWTKSYIYDEDGNLVDQIREAS